MALQEILQKKPLGIPMPAWIVAGAAGAYWWWSGRTTALDEDVAEGVDESAGASGDASAFDPASAGLPGSATTYVTKNVTVQRPQKKRRKCPPGTHRVNGRCVPRKPRRGGGRAAGRIGTSSARAVAARR